MSDLIVEPGTSERIEDSPPSTKARLPAYFLNANSVLRQPLPQLHRGPDTLETIAKPPKITRYYNGPIAIWDNCKVDAMDFFKSEVVGAELTRCAEVPIHMSPEIAKLNCKAMTVERTQVGAEVSISGRLFSNLFAVVTNTIETLTAPQHGISENPELLPKQIVFGDSWTVPKPNRVNSLYPDVVMKASLGGRDVVVAVGELKFYLSITGGFKEMIRQIKGEAKMDLDRFSAILGKSLLCCRKLHMAMLILLGQVVEYMIKFKRRLAFLSNYEETVFLRIAARTSGEPCLYFSDIFAAETSTPEESNDPSVRIGLFYFTHLTSSPDEEIWQLDDDMYSAMSKLISKESRSNTVLSTPFGNRTQGNAAAGTAVSSLRLNTLSFRGPGRHDEDDSSHNQESSSSNTAPRRGSRSRIPRRADQMGR